MRSESSRNVTTIRKRPIAGRYLEQVNTVSVHASRSLVWGQLELAAGAGEPPRSNCTRQVVDVRLHWVGQSVQPVLNLASLLADGVEWARVTGGIGAAGATERVLVAKVVSGGATDLGHGGKERQGVSDIKVVWWKKKNSRAGIEGV